MTLEAYLPHRAPMLLVDEVEEASAGFGTARVRVNAEAWYADAEGAMPAWIGLELMAQAVAACRGKHLSLSGGAPEGGYLVGTRSYRSSLPAFPPNASLLVKVRLLEEDPTGLSAWECDILHDGVSVAQATLKVMRR